MQTKNKAYLLAAALAAAAAGCLSVGPDWERPESADPAAPAPDAGMPTTNRTETGELKPAEGDADVRKTITRESLLDWWKAFDDPVLTGLVDRAVTNNLSLLMAQHRLSQARWQLLGAASGLFPQLSAGAGAGIAEYGKTTPTGAGRHLHTDHFQAGFDATWEIDIFGGVRRGVESAEAQVLAAVWSEDNTWVSLAAEIGAQYVNLRTVQQRLKVARANLKLQQETHDLLLKRFNSGIGDKLAVSQSKYILEQTRAQIPALLADEESIVNGLEILAGAMPGTLHDTLLPVPDREWKLEPQKLAEIPFDWIRNRPDVKQAEANLKSAVASVGVAKSMYYPRLFINGTLGLESASFSDFFKRSSLLASIGPSVSWPIFQGGSIRAKVKIAEHKVKEAAYGYELAVRTAVAETRNAYAAYTRQYHRNQSLEEAVKAAKEATSIAQDLYSNGLADFNNVLDAQRSQLSLEEALVISRGQITMNLISLYKALGAAGWGLRNNVIKSKLREKAQEKAKVEAQEKPQDKPQAAAQENAPEKPQAVAQDKAQENTPEKPQAVAQEKAQDKAKVEPQDKAQEKAQEEKK